MVREALCKRPKECKNQFNCILPQKFLSTSNEILHNAPQRHNYLYFRELQMVSARKLWELLLSWRGVERIF